MFFSQGRYALYSCNWCLRQQLRGLRWHCAMHKANYCTQCAPPPAHGVPPQRTSTSSSSTRPPSESFPPQSKEAPSPLAAAQRSRDRSRSRGLLREKEEPKEEPKEEEWKDQDAPAHSGWEECNYDGEHVWEEYNDEEALVWEETGEDGNTAFYCGRELPFGWCAPAAGRPCDSCHRYKVKREEVKEEQEDWPIKEEPDEEVLAKQEQKPRSKISRSQKNWSHSFNVKARKWTEFHERDGTPQAPRSQEDVQAFLARRDEEYQELVRSQAFVVFQHHKRARDPSTSLMNVPQANTKNQFRWNLLYRQFAWALIIWAQDQERPELVASLSAVHHRQMEKYRLAGAPQDPPKKLNGKNAVKDHLRRRSIQVQEITKTWLWQERNQDRLSPGLPYPSCTEKNSDHDFFRQVEMWWDSVVGWALAKGWEELLNGLASPDGLYRRPRNVPSPLSLQGK